MKQIFVNGKLFITVYSDALIYVRPELNGRSLLFIRQGGESVTEFIEENEVIEVK